MVIDVIPRLVTYLRPCILQWVSLETFCPSWIGSTNPGTAYVAFNIRFFDFQTDHLYISFIESASSWHSRFLELRRWSEWVFFTRSRKCCCLWVCQWFYPRNFFSEPRSSLEPISPSFIFYLVGVAFYAYRWPERYLPENVRNVLDLFGANSHTIWHCLIVLAINQHRYGMQLMKDGLPCLADYRSSWKRSKLWRYDTE